MKNGIVLILEDDPDWQDRHRLYLQDCGYQTQVVETADAAIHAIETDRTETIRFVLADEVLVPPLLRAAGIQGMSSKSGGDALEAIRALRRDFPIRCAMITESSMKKATQTAVNPIESVGRFIVEHETLQRKVGKDTLLLAKHRFEDPVKRKAAYAELAEYFGAPLGTESSATLIRRLLVGLGFEAKILRELLARAHVPQADIEAVLNRRRVLPFADFVSRLDNDAPVAELPRLCATALNKLLTIRQQIRTWQPGDGPIPKSDWIKARGVAVQVGVTGEPEPEWNEVLVWTELPPAELQVLDVLGFNAETALVRRLPASREFNPMHYNGTERAPKEEELGRLAHPVGSRLERQAQTKELQAAGGNEETPSGVHQEKRRRSPQASRLSRILTPLRKKLGDREPGEKTHVEKPNGEKQEVVRLGLGPRESVIRHIEETNVYRTAFDTRLVLYTHIPINKGGRPRSANPKKSR